MMRKPGLVIPILVQIIGWGFIVWFIGDLLSYHTPLILSMMFLHIFLGIALILTGLFLYKLASWTR